MTRRIFLSYSHHDRTWRDAFRQMLGPALERFGVELWADDNIKSGDGWERVIGDGLAEVELGLLLVTPAYLESSFSWDIEIPTLLDAEVPITWVLVKACGWEHKALLRERQGLQDPKRDGALADHRHRNRELDRVCRKLCDEHVAKPVAAPPPRVADSAPPQGAFRRPVPISAARKGYVFGPVPERPFGFVARIEEFERLRADLLGELSGAVGVVGKPSPLGLHGRGGIGKTVLASELTRDPETLVHFPDGLFWLSLGERPDVVGAQRQLATWLGGDAEAIRSPLQGAKVLRHLASDKQALLVLDDVWSLGAAQALAATGPKGRVLLTTRDKAILDRLGAETVALDVFSREAARELLGQLTGTPSWALPPEADHVLEATGLVALAVALLGAAVGRGNQSWATVARRLAEGGELFTGHPYSDTFKALEVATASLEDDELVRYQALSCFPEDTVIPTVTIGRLWGLAEPDLSETLRRFADLKLARLEDSGLFFHDLERDYLLLHAEATALAHDQLLTSHYAAAGTGWSGLDPRDPYLWDHLTYHLAAAGRHHELVVTVADPAWLAARITRDGSLAAERDVRDALHWEPGDLRLRALVRRLVQISHLLDRARRLGAVPATLATQLRPLRGQLELARLDAVPFGPQPVVSWIADTMSPELIRVLGGHAGSALSVAWSPDGTRLASGGDDLSVRVWDVDSGAELRTVSGNSGYEWSVAWSPDGTRLATGGDDGSVRVWDAASGVELGAFSGHSSPVLSVAWSPDGTRLASGDVDGRVRLCGAASGAELRTLSAAGESVWSVAWSPDGTRLASGASDGNLRVWDAATGRELRNLRGHTGSVRSVAWSPDGTCLASGASDVRVWDAASGVELFTLSAVAGPVWSVAWSSDGSCLASAGSDGTIRVWDAANRAGLGTLLGHIGWVRSVAWSPDGKRLASAGSDGTIRVWDAADGAEPGTFSAAAGSVLSVAWSPDGIRLATGADDGRVRVWEAPTGAELGSLSAAAGSVLSVAWSPDGNRLASSGVDGRVRIWDASTGAEVRALSGHTGWVRTVAWSPDATLLASGADDGTVRIWDASTGREVRALAEHTGAVRTVAWSPDATLLASGADDGTVRIWDASTGAEVRALSEHTGSVSSVAWSPDATLLATGSDDGSVAVWDAVGSAALVVVVGDRVSAIAFSGRGDLAVVGDRSVVVYSAGTA